MPQDVFELRGYDVLDAQFVRCQATGVAPELYVTGMEDSVTLITLSHGNAQLNFFITMYKNNMVL